MLNLPNLTSRRLSGNSRNNEKGPRSATTFFPPKAITWCHINRATYGSLLSSGLRTTSRLKKAAAPKASLSPCPPVSCTSHRNSVVFVARHPVYSVNTREVASCASGVRLFFPWYGELNEGCHCEMKFACPESHSRSHSACGNIVVSELSDGSTEGSAAAAASSGAAAFSCARTFVQQLIHTRQAASSFGANHIPRPMMYLRMLLLLMAAVLPRCGFLRPRFPGHTAAHRRSLLPRLQPAHLFSLRARTRLHTPASPGPSR